MVVRFNGSAFFNSPHLINPFPPRIDKDVLKVLSQEEITGTQRVVLDMVNHLAGSMCPDLLDDRVLAGKVEVVSAKGTLEEKLPAFLLHVEKASCMFLEVLRPEDSYRPKLLVLGALDGQTMVLRLDMMLGPGCSSTNWFSLLPSCLREAIRNPAFPLLVQDVQNLSGVSGLSDVVTIDTTDLLRVLRGHEFFAWADKRDFLSRPLDIFSLCHLLYGHLFGLVTGGESGVRQHVARYGNPYPENEWPSWRHADVLGSWGSCLDTFQLTHLHCRVVASFIPVVLYGVFSLTMACFFADKDSCMFSTLTGCVQKLRYKGAADDLLFGYRRGPLCLFGPIDLLSPSHQYKIGTAADFEAAFSAIYDIDQGVSVPSTTMANSRNKRLVLANMAVSSRTEGETTVGSTPGLVSANRVVGALCSETTVRKASSFACSSSASNSACLESSTSVIVSSEAAVTVGAAAAVQSSEPGDFANTVAQGLVPEDTVGGCEANFIADRVARPSSLGETTVGVKRISGRSMQGDLVDAAKRTREDEDLIELHYDSDGEFGSLAKGRAPASDGFANIIRKWKRSPFFLRAGYNEPLEKAPLRFRMSVQMKNVCKFCAKSGHKGLSKCPSRRQVIKKFGEDVVAWDKQCLYPLCQSPKTHMVLACPTLHSRCCVCKCRGHASEECSSSQEEVRRLRGLFEDFADQGKFTVRRHVEPAWGWRSDHTARLDELVVFRGTKQSRYLEWTEKDGDPSHYLREELEKKANNYYWG